MNFKLLSIFVVLAVLSVAQAKQPESQRKSVRNIKYANAARLLHARAVKHARHNQQRRHGHFRNVTPEPKWREALSNAWNSIKEVVKPKTTVPPARETTTAPTSRAPESGFPPAVPGGQWVPIETGTDGPVGAHTTGHWYVAPAAEASTPGYEHPAGTENWAPQENGGLHWPDESTQGYDHSGLPIVDGGYWVPINASEASTENYDYNNSATEDYHQGYDNSAGTEDYRSEYSTSGYWQHESSPDYGHGWTEGSWDQSTPGYEHEQWSTSDGLDGYWSEYSTPDYSGSSDGYWGEYSTPDYWGAPGTEDYWFEHSTPDSSYGYTESPPAGHYEPPMCQPAPVNSGCAVTITINQGGCGQPVVQQQCGAPPAPATSPAPEPEYTTSASWGENVEYSTPGSWGEDLPSSAPNWGTGGDHYAAGK